MNNSDDPKPLAILMAIFIIMNIFLVNNYFNENIQILMYFPVFLLSYLVLFIFFKWDILNSFGFSFLFFIFYTFVTHNLNSFKFFLNNIFSFSLCY
jgi:hypothetical protein